MLALVKQLRAARQVYVDLGDGLSVTLLRPRESEFGAFRSMPVADMVAKAAVDWAGFTEASFFGEAVGSIDPLPFSTELWDEAVRDKGDWLERCVTELGEAVSRHLEARQAEEKN